MITTVATFEINYVRYMDEHGKLLDSLPASVTPEILVGLYKDMVLLRLFDKKGVALQRTGKMGTYAPTLGQEAISVAAGKALQKNDSLVPYYREYAAQFARGVTMSEIYRFWGGDERANDYQASPDFPMAVPIASQLLHAVGIAYAFKYRHQKNAVITFCGDGGTSEGDFYEAINVAGAWNLPVVFVINNNQWAISVPRSVQTAAQTIAQKAIAAGIEGIQVDGNDAAAMFDVTQKALQKARDGKGPTLIEALSYRLCDHTTADDASRYVNADELKKAWDFEPLLRLKKYLIAEKLWDETKEAAFIAEGEKQIEKAVEIYLSTEAPPKTDMIDYHYASLPNNLVEQRLEILEGL